jgi:hypothetical protein
VSAAGTASHCCLGQTRDTTGFHACYSVSKWCCCREGLAYCWPSFWHGAAFIAPPCAPVNLRGGAASSELPCHHHHSPGKRPAASCSDRQFPQFDVPRILSALTTRPIIGVANSGLCPSVQVPSPNETAGLLISRALRPRGIPFRPFIVLRI